MLYVFWLQQAWLLPASPPVGRCGAPPPTRYPDHARQAYPTLPKPNKRLRECGPLVHVYSLFKLPCLKHRKKNRLSPSAEDADGKEKMRKIPVKRAVFAGAFTASWSTFFKDPHSGGILHTLNESLNAIGTGVLWMTIQSP
uniref:Uncharacterized protein n=1 Tax=Magnetococcus massalia (strain MO-1) TaxID=451514 RepID=A0A1S7LGW5_MAGMO|nr:protein of unknown function [Candidatus Magnetococcus massalia]